MPVADVSSKKMKEIIDNEKIVLVDMWASGCAPCRIMSSLFDDLSEENKQVCFIRIKIDEDTSIAEEYGIKSVPAFLLFKDGVLKKKRNGLMTFDTLKGMLFE